MPYFHKSELEKKKKETVRGDGKEEGWEGMPSEQEGEREF